MEYRYGGVGLVWWRLSFGGARGGTRYRGWSLSLLTTTMMTARSSYSAWGIALPCPSPCSSAEVHVDALPRLVVVVDDDDGRPVQLQRLGHVFASSHVLSPCASCPTDSCLAALENPGLVAVTGCAMRVGERAGKKVSVLERGA